MNNNPENTNHQAQLYVQGRLCLFGEHSDWAADYGVHKGFCIVTGTDQGIRATARSSRHFRVKTRLPDDLGRHSGRTRQMTCPWEAESLLEAAKDETEFFRYAAGVAYQMLSRRNLPGGIDVQIKTMDLPLKKGVSSSAAVCILIAKAFDAVYQQRMFPHELMELAYLGERLTGSQCGRMDQACIYGKTPVLLVFEKEKRVRIEPVRTGADIQMFFVDLAGKKDTVKILSDLQSSYEHSEQLRQALGQANEQFVRLAYQAMVNGDAEELGSLMSQAQQNFDRFVAPCSAEELKSPLLHNVLNFEDAMQHTYGGKGVGSQGDGTAQFVSRSAEDRDAAMAKIEQAFPQMRCFPLTIPKGNS